MSKVEGGLKEAVHLSFKEEVVKRVEINIEGRRGASQE